MQAADISQSAETRKALEGSRPELDLASRWHVAVSQFCGWVFFDRITVLNRERLTAEGPTLYIALHRNGAADAYVYHGVLTRINYMVSRQLRKNWFLRLWFGGIEVIRDKDVRPGEDQQEFNRRAFDACVDHLENNGELLIFPEGTSTLGPTHLPFKSGAVRIAMEVLKRGKPVTIIPLGVRYERPWAFRSRAEVQVGKPITFRSADLRELKRRCHGALREIGVNVPSEAYQERIHKLAYAATLGADNSYYRVLKHFETAIPEDLDNELTDLENNAEGQPLLRHQGVPLFPIGSRLPYLLALIPCACLVLGAAILNALPLLGGWWASRKCADDRNVIALWKILVGIPLATINLGIILTTSIILGNPWLPVLYLGISVLGLKLFHRTEKLAIATFNSFINPSLRAPALKLREGVLTELQKTTEKQQTTEV